MRDGLHLCAAWGCDPTAQPLQEVLCKAAERVLQAIEAPQMEEERCGILSSRGSSLLVEECCGGRGV